MQLIAVAATTPALNLLSRTRAYFGCRIAGALFAGVASVGWIAERLLNVHTPIDIVVDSAADHATWIASSLFLFSFVCWSRRRVFDEGMTITQTPSDPAPERI